MNRPAPGKTGGENGAVYLPCRQLQRQPPIRLIKLNHCYVALINVKYNQTIKQVNAMRKALFFIIISSVLLFLPQKALAADALYRMLHADDCADFQADQDALIVGQLIAQNGDSFTVEVNKVLNGSAPAGIIALSSDFQYGWADTSSISADTSNILMKPKVDDYCVVSMKKHGSYYKKAWGIFKATTGDYRTLKLLSEDIKYPYYSGDIAAIEWYVNSGGTEKEFFFDQNRVYVSRPNGETHLIYTGENSAGADQPEIIYTKKSDNTLFVDMKSVVPAIAVLCAVCAAAIAVIVKRKRP